MGFTSICAQIFVTGPQSFREILKEDDIAQCAQLSREIPIVIHGSYLDAPWNRAPGAVHNIKRELEIAERIGARGVIVHLGAGAANDDNLKYVLEQLSGTLWLEIHAAKSSPFTYETPARIRGLFARVSKCNLTNLQVGLCIDTAHLFACGCALADARAMSDWLAGLPDVPVMIHLNDSASVLGSGKDKHAALTRGNLWGAYNRENGHRAIEESGLVTLLAWAEDHNAMVILERTPDEIDYDLGLVSDLGFFNKSYD
jgi:deoxyribonuclease-4